MNVVLRKIGNSEGFILPKELLDRHNLKAGDVLAVIENGDDLVLKPIDDSFERQLKAAREVMDQYKVALQKLAE
ncbi:MULTISPECIES: AbrB/MazE/SpoVT family DNA-binding domain-containing protein [Phyllobacteriaceae]|uniref:AbrB/MazE/SpoVT family DNA-binding domain-containing protein n=1 Tax=Phyllobacterium phragmitis TaxID=2670329 RepID=A0ABQ0GXG9_9HYPH|nr:AbrB/MazE/SpoVT family DNA-binding domain-containing protein [Mesorhizobium sp. RMAD-H1]MBB2970104.1 putative addiction module antidote [Mesorhizobium sp. RMAD-H1]